MSDESLCLHWLHTRWPLVKSMQTILTENNLNSLNYDTSHELFI